MIKREEPKIPPGIERLTRGAVETPFSEPSPKALFLVGKRQDKAIFEALRGYHFKWTKDLRPIVWELTASDIRNLLPKKLRKTHLITVRRSLRDLESLGLIKLHKVGYNRTGFSLSRFDV